MCRPTTCKACGKTGWAGCGMHVDQVLAGVPKSQRCSCTAEQKRAASPMGRLTARFRRG